MSSFKRRAQSNQAAPAKKGTQPVPGSASLLQVSSGISSLDDLLGGGLPLGHVLLVLAPDYHSAWGELVSRYFIAQGLSSAQRVLVCSDHPSRLASGCMWHPGTARNQAQSPAEYEEKDESVDNGDNKVKIAWRYEQLKQFKTTVDESNAKDEDFCHTFDLATTIPPAIISKAANAGSLAFEEPGSEQNCLDSYAAILNRLSALLGETPSDKTILRVCVNNLGSACWSPTNPSVILSFLLRLRSLIRNTEACVLITLTPQLSSSTYADYWIPKLAQLSDGCFTFQGITSDPVLGPTFPSYSGLLSVHSTPSPHTFLDPSRRFSQLRGLNLAGTASGTGGGENNLAFKCMRKRFVVETLHLDVEGGVGERRTTPATLQANPEPQHPVPAAQSATQLAKVHIEAPPEAPRELPSTSEVETPKKTKKKVAFRSADTDLYDF